MAAGAAFRPVVSLAAASNVWDWVDAGYLRVVRIVSFHLFTYHQQAVCPLTGEVMC